MPVVASLFIHPIKSCRGIALDEARLDRFGFVDDRRYVVVDENGKFITQRSVPRLAWLEARTRNGHLTLGAPDMETVSLPTRPASDAAIRDTAIWSDSVRGADMGDAAAEWLTRFLQRPTRLLGMPEDFERQIRSTTAHPGDHAAFSDAFPLLIISEASLADLNERIDPALAGLPMDRFRPNLVIRDCPAYAEDVWKRIRIGSVTLRAAGPCSRCVMTTTNQQTLERGKEPLRTLAQYRRNTEGEVMFGQNYIHETKSGVIQVGAPVEVLE